MNLYRKSTSPSYINTQSKDHSDALERAEALLKRIEQRLHERNQNSSQAKNFSNTDTSPIHSDNSRAQRKLDS
jgi:Tfp pilus assembly protein PilX